MKATAAEELILALTGIGDMERLMGRIVYGSAGGRDMVSLKNAMDHLPAICQQLAAFEGGHLRELGARLDPLEDLAEVIGMTLQDDPPFSVREGEFIRDGFDLKWTGCGASSTAARASSPPWRLPRRKRPASAP